MRKVEVGMRKVEDGKRKARKISADNKRQMSGFGFQVSGKNREKGGIK